MVDFANGSFCVDNGVVLGFSSGVVESGFGFGFVGLLGVSLKVVSLGEELKEATLLDTTLNFESKSFRNLEGFVWVFQKVFN